jgi:hypothetical protein
MRAAVLLLGFGMLVACTTDLGGRTVGDAGGRDGAAADAAADGSAARDAAIDAGTPPVDTGAGPVDAGTDSGGCAPSFTLDLCPSGCGDVPDGCGGTVPCAACGAPDLWCAPGTGMFQAAVRAAVESVMAAHPEYFDPVMFRDTSSWLVIDDAAYDAAVIAALEAMGLVAISDPNDDHEIRVRAAGSDLAENYGIRVHATNRTWYRYQGVCETTGF